MKSRWKTIQAWYFWHHGFSTKIHCIRYWFEHALVYSDKERSCLSDGNWLSNGQWRAVVCIAGVCQEAGLGKEPWGARQTVKSWIYRVKTVCRAPFYCLFARILLFAICKKFMLLEQYIKAKIIGKEKIFVKFLPKPRTDGEKVSFYKWRGYHQNEVMLMRWKMAMPMHTKENSAEKFIKIGRNFFWNRVLTREKCPFISEGVTH